MVTRKNEIDMLKGPLLKSLFIFSLPLIASSVLQLVFNAADIIVVGKFAGDLYLAAVTATSQICNLLVSLFNGLAVGVNVYIARLIGEAKRDKISSAMHTSMCFALICGIIVACAGQLLARPLLLKMSTPSDVVELSKTYLKIYFLGTPANLIYNYGAAVLRAKGDTKRPLTYLTIAGIVNVILNLFMVIVLKMNVDGVAIATIVSQTICAVLVVIALINEENEFKFKVQEFKIDAYSLKEILILGLPAGLQMSLFSISNTVLQSCINTFGTDTVAGNGIASTTESIANVIVGAIQTSVMTFVSQNYGAKNKKRVIKISLYGVLLMLVWCVIFAFVTFAFGKDILSIYSNSNTIIEIGYSRSKIMMYTYMLLAMMHLGAGILRGMGYSMTPAIICLIGVCFIRLLLVWVVFKDYLTYELVIYTYPITWLISTIALWGILIYLYIKNKD